jgi:hypothetical protein
MSLQTEALDNRAWCSVALEALKSLWDGENHRAWRNSAIEEKRRGTSGRWRRFTPWLPLRSAEHSLVENGALSCHLSKSLQLRNSPGDDPHSRVQLVFGGLQRALTFLIPSVWPTLQADAPKTQKASLQGVLSLGDQILASLGKKSVTDLIEEHGTSPYFLLSVAEALVARERFEAYLPETVGNPEIDTIITLARSISPLAPALFSQWSH